MKTEPLDWQRIASETGADVVWHTETGSTNDDARQLALKGAAHGTAVLAEAQRYGRGRRGAAWISPPQRNLLCSVVLRPSLPVEKWSRLTHACALAVCEALEGIPDLPPPQIKWPNDVYLRGRKVCGILVESAVDARGSFAIAGVGINLNLTAGDLPEELRDSATSVWLERGGQPVSREAFAIQFLRRLHVNCLRAEKDIPELLADCESRSYLSGKRISLLTGSETMEGLAAGLGPEGELRLVLPGGQIKLVSSADYVRPTDNK
ncbi:MAG TPA: biotin--[acetyl-CoA-carboxylase] ligase [Verrucomicrobiales bacterium]|nr:biotin--[acetyl-CoA-carboxylase] ligase [Verrucomicrobiales bacterium]